MINFKNASAEFSIIVDKNIGVKLWDCVSINLWEITDTNIGDNICDGLWSDVKTTVDHSHFKRYQLLEAFKNLS